METLIQNYIDFILNSCDMDMLYDMARENLEKNLSEYSEDQLITEIKENAPNLIEDDK